jgi:hypothetical protein
MLQKTPQIIMKKNLRIISTVYIIIAFISWSSGNFQTFPLLTFAYVGAVLAYSMNKFTQTFWLRVATYIIGFFWILQLISEMETSGTAWYSIDVAYLIYVDYIVRRLDRKAGKK